jgi:hypothetical protein
MVDEDIRTLTRVDSKLKDRNGEVGKYDAHQNTTYTCLLTIASCGCHSLAIEGIHVHRPFHNL